MLVGFGVDLSTATNNGMTPLRRAAIIPSHLRHQQITRFETATELIKLGAPMSDLEIRRPGGERGRLAQGSALRMGVGHPFLAREGSRDLPCVAPYQPTDPTLLGREAEDRRRLRIRQSTGITDQWVAGARAKLQSWALETLAHSRDCFGLFLFGCSGRGGSIALNLLDGKEHELQQIAAFAGVVVGKELRRVREVVEPPAEDDDEAGDEEDDEETRELARLASGTPGERAYAHIMVRSRGDEDEEANGARVVHSFACVNDPCPLVRVRQ